MFFLDIVAAELTDEVLKSFLDLDKNLTISIHMETMEGGKAQKLLRSKLSEVQKSKIDEQKKAFQGGYDIDILPSDIVLFEKETQELLRELNSSNQKLIRLSFRSDLVETERNLEAAKEAVSKPFPKEQELSGKLARLAELDQLLNMGDRGMEADGQEKENFSEIVEKSGDTRKPERSKDITGSNETKKNDLGSGSLIAAETAGSYMQLQKPQSARSSVRMKLELYRQNHGQEMHPDKRERSLAKHREQSL